MREIKLRAWYEGELWEVWKTEWHRGELFAASLSRSPSNQFWYKEREGEIAFIQYTGLKDKGGKDICEGDIIKSNTWDDCGVGQIKWIDDSACFGLVWDTGAFWGLTKIGDMEIIGNIYENPELLEGTK